jgi:hypothetical protein
MATANQVHNQALEGLKQRHQQELLQLSATSLNANINATNTTLEALGSIKDEDESDALLRELRGIRGEHNDDDESDALLRELRGIRGEHNDDDVDRFSHLRAATARGQSATRGQSDFDIDEYEDESAEYDATEELKRISEQKEITDEDIDYILRLRRALTKIDEGYVDAIKEKASSKQRDMLKKFLAQKVKERRESRMTSSNNIGPQATRTRISATQDRRQSQLEQDLGTPSTSMMAKRLSMMSQGRQSADRPPPPEHSQNTPGKLKERIGSRVERSMNRPPPPEHSQNPGQQLSRSTLSGSEPTRVSTPVRPEPELGSVARGSVARGSVTRLRPRGLGEKAQARPPPARPEPEARVPTPVRPEPEARQQQRGLSFFLGKKGATSPPRSSRRFDLTPETSPEEPYREPPVYPPPLIVSNPLPPPEARQQQRGLSFFPRKKGATSPPRASSRFDLTPETSPPVYPSPLIVSNPLPPPEERGQSESRSGLLMTRNPPPPPVERGPSMPRTLPRPPPKKAFRAQSEPRPSETETGLPPVTETGLPPVTETGLPPVTETGLPPVTRHPTGIFLPSPKESSASKPKPKPKLKSNLKSNPSPSVSDNRPPPSVSHNRFVNF